MFSLHFVCTYYTVGVSVESIYIILCQLEMEKLQLKISVKVYNYVSNVHELRF